MRIATLCFVRRGRPPAEILLGLKKAGFGAGKYVGFGGKIENGETAAEAAVRELQEETGIKASIEHLTKAALLTFLFPSKPEWNHQVHAFLAERWQGEPHESAEVQPSWFRLDEIPFDAMWDDSRYWLPLVLAGRRFDARFTFNPDNDTVATAAIHEWD